MSNLAPAEEQLITGNAMGSFQISDQPSIGDVLTFTITDSVLGTFSPTYTVQAADLKPTANIVNPAEASVTFSVALNAVSAINKVVNAAGYTAAAAMPADLFSPQYMPPYFAEVIITGPNATFSSIAASVVGNTNLIVGQPVSPSPISTTVNNVVCNGYVALLDALAMRMSTAELSLWLKNADVVDFRPDEVAARDQLYGYYCMMLSRDLGGKEYVKHFFGGSSAGASA